MKSVRLAAAPASAKRLSMGLDDLDESCQRAVDQAQEAYADAARNGTSASVLAAKGAVRSAWKTLGVMSRIARDPDSDPGDACAAGIVALDEGRKLLTLQRALRRLESTLFAR